MLARRRLLAALLTAIAVAAGLQAASAPPPPTRTVLVAARDLPSGVVLRRGDLTEAAYAAGSLPSGLAADAVGRTLASPLRRGEPVTDVRLVGPRLTADRPGLVAVPVRLPDAGMVALLEVGDVIDLVAADPQGGEARQVSDGVPVLAIPATTADAGATGLGGRIVVVGVREEDVPVLADAAARLFVTFSYDR